MARIGIYKSGKKIYFNQNNEDHSAISIEVTRIGQILVSHDHQVEILSETDSHPQLDLNGLWFDKVLVFNGPDLTKDIVEGLYRATDVVDLIVTDMSLLPDESVMQLFINVYSQSMTWNTYGAIQEHECFEYSPCTYTKIIQLYFGGTERGRSKDFFEYVYRPNIKWYGKSDSLGIRNYIPYHEHIEQMKMAKYSIAIGDEEYNKNGFVTPRYFECIRYGVIPFVDMKYDPNEILIKKNDFRRVSDYKEMMSKIRYLENDLVAYHMTLVSQQIEITKDQIEGNNINKLLTGTNVQ